ncbi:hypothetical protein [Stagnihabitans tardus]|uniref:DUF3309 domain-containing protein n=1 Tax=Stagnihabitans tardus TaxID=2699202 RepID=A0AAE5BV63_9RHOB|nr:hypothetical protein [Stagnihabitans tardus]NBZ87499.1 hypothetical protein [Stagnihabitans tardus]
MRKILLAGLLAATLSPGAVLAGGVPEMPEAYATPHYSSGGDIIVPLLLLLVIGAAVGG